MTQELDSKLCAKYPKIFADRNADMLQTAMCWGFECGDGWYWIIDNLCDSIQGYIDSNKHLNISQVVATQVKEKFGGLRFYYNGGDQLIEGMSWLAEHLSLKTCEECGSKDNIGMTSGWLKTICRPCYDLMDYGERRAWNPRKGE
jgi:hypothetical protein